jgi:hypothetical protein
MQNQSDPKGPGIDIQALLTEFDASRQRGADFARSKGIPPWKLYHALSARRRKSARANPVQRNARPDLVAVRLTPHGVHTAPSKLELALPGGQRCPLR